MSVRFGRLIAGAIVPGWLIAACMATSVQAQSASLWETGVTVSGRAVRPPARSCIAGGVDAAMAVRWPESCTAAPVTGRGAHAVSEVVCRVDGSGTALAIRREVRGDPRTRLEIVTTTHVTEANGDRRAGQDVTMRALYLGSCSATPTPIRDPRHNSNATETIGFVAIGIAQLILFVAMVYGSIVGMGWLAMRLGRARYANTAVDNIVVGDDGAATIPVLATFTGVRGLPWWYGVATNNAKPLLVIAKEGIRFRVIRLRRRAYADIECVDVRQARGTVNLDITFRGELLTFAANLGAVPLATHVLTLLPAGTPLSARATALLATHGVLD